MTTARFIAAARLEFLGQIEYYEAESPGLGVRFRLAVEAAVAQAVEFPDAGSPTQRSMRRVIVRGFRFAVVYRREANDVVIFAVAHHSRRPGYWASRVGPDDT